MGPDRKTIARVAFWLSLAYGAALAGMPLYAALVGGDSASFMGALIAVTWTAAPVYCAAGFVSASPNRTGAAFFLLFELLLIASFVWPLVASLSSSTGGIIFFVWPLLQWTAIVLAFPLALAFGWRMRPDFLKD